MVRLRESYESGDRLVTIVGAPGVGKTRLAIEYLRSLDASSSLRVCFCDASEAHDDGELCASVASALGASMERGHLHDRGALVRALGSGKPLLLAIDNLEQVVAVAAQRFAEWLEACPDLSLLATSRERLRIAGETALELAPLALPELDADPMAADAVRLFVDRARARMSSFRVGRDNEAAVTEIVRLLGGLPLAIELAAARAGFLSLGELARRLHQSLDVVSRGERHAPPRHTSLRAAVSWSWELLTRQEQDALRQCAVFRGGFDIHAAEAVLRGDPARPGTEAGGPVLELLHSLADKSMIRAEASTGGATRFDLFFGVREFAAEELDRAGDATAVRSRHAAYYATAGAAWAVEIERTGSSEARSALARERGNLLAAHEFSWAGGLCARESLLVVLRTILALEPVFGVHGPIDRLLQLLDAFFRHPAASGVEEEGLRARGLRAHGKALQLSGMLEAAERDIESAVALVSGSTDDWTVASIVADSGVLHHQRRHLEIARSRYEQALALYERLGSKRQQARLLGNVGALHHDLRDFEMAEAYYVRALELLRRLSEPAFEGNLLSNLGVLCQEQERYEPAADYFERAESALKQAGDLRLLGIARGNWGVLELERGHPDTAFALLTSALRQLEEFGDSSSIALCLARLGATKAAVEAHDTSQADLERARRLVSREEEPLLAATIDLYDVYRKLRAEVPPSGDVLRATRARIRTARQPAREGTASAEELSDDVRSAIRLIEREVRRAEPLAPFLDGAPQDALVIGADALWFCPPRGVSQRLSQNGAVRRILVALVRAHEAGSSEGLDLNQLRDAGWPGEKMTPEAAANRVHVALAELRRKGLKACIRRSPSGVYGFAPGLTIHRASAESPLR